MDAEDMRSLDIYGKKDIPIIEELNNIKKWSLQTDERGGNRYFLEKNEIKIYIRLVNENSAETVNVLPQDQQEGPIKISDDALLCLKNDLQEEGIECKLNISENDMKKLLDME